MKKIVDILLVICISFPVIAFTQSNVTKVFYYDSDWNKIESRENASYSRIISENSLTSLKEYGMNF